MHPMPEHATVALFGMSAMTVAVALFVVGRGEYRHPAGGWLLLILYFAAAGGGKWAIGGLFADA